MATMLIVNKNMCLLLFLSLLAGGSAHTLATTKSFLSLMRMSTKGLCTDSCRNGANCGAGDFTGKNFHGAGICIDCCCGNRRKSFEATDFGFCCGAGRGPKDPALCPTVNEKAIVAEQEQKTKEVVVEASPVTEAPAVPDAAGPVFDGFLPMGCFPVATPKSLRLYYNDEVPKMDRKPMTKQVCFNFCRGKMDKLPGPAGFFALQNGRDCFCAAYLQQGVDGSGQCDAVCEGDKVTVCGNTKGKVSGFAMHSCGDTLKEADELVNKAKALVKMCTEEEDFWEQTQAKVDATIFGASDSKSRYTFQGEAVAFAGLLRVVKKDSGSLDAAADKTKATLKTADLGTSQGQQEVEADIEQQKVAYTALQKSKKALEEYISENFKVK